jgi:SAM-dependent methyltransferase
MLHPAKVLTSIYWNARISLRLFLGLKKRKPASSVLFEGSEVAFERYSRVCRFYLAHIHKAEILNAHVCEVGCGDCLASADMLLSLGAAHVDLIETLPILVDQRQEEILKKCAEHDALPNRNVVLGPTGAIDQTRISIIPQYLENVEGRDKYKLILSFDVLEHVEDIAGFFGNCHRLLLPGGLMIHKIDLSGHGLLEDPLPPLDFQTYSDFLYGMMYSKYRRATRRLQGAILDSIRSAGFTVEEIGVLRAADVDYVEALRPRLRKPIREKPADELKVLDWYLVARKA